MALNATTGTLVSATIGVVSVGGALRHMSLVMLSFTAANYTKWAIYMRASLGRARLIGHIDGTITAAPTEAPWSVDDYTVLNVLVAAVDEDVVDMQSDALADNDSPVSARALVLNTLRGLGPRFVSAATVISMTDHLPSFLRVRSMLLMEEMQQANADANAASTALITQVPRWRRNPGVAPHYIPPPSTFDVLLGSSCSTDSSAGIASISSSTGPLQRARPPLPRLLGPAATPLLLLMIDVLTLIRCMALGRVPMHVCPRHLLFQCRVRAPRDSPLHLPHHLPRPLRIEAPSSPTLRTTLFLHCYARCHAPHGLDVLFVLPPGSTCRLQLLVLPPAPTTFRQAMQDPLWPAAMADEHQALIDNQTWFLVPHPPHANVFMGKWIFRHKFHTDGSLARNKARWVVRGYSQRPEIFSELTKRTPRVLFFPRSFQKTEGDTKWGHEVATPQGGAAKGCRAALWCGPLVSLPTLPFRLLILSVAKPYYREPRYEKSSRDAAAANPISGDSGDRLRHPAGEGNHHMEDSTSP
ncbi:hypothetical protein QYE76_047998 [Lolium multiflorum]|uniref:Uncharacterized protein n=1 Tax=Lolium multiflorum TaxID=4521 RepID=A0AAD8X044_LOLMU|nr:hypothetical protein QYE76_047998 [Lolium multiflorum]